MRPQGSPAELERPRLRAIEPFQRAVRSRRGRPPRGQSPLGASLEADAPTTRRAGLRARVRSHRRASSPRTSDGGSRAWPSPARKLPGTARACGRAAGSSISVVYHPDHVGGANTPPSLPCPA
jgi:hypothetical protein